MKFLAITIFLSTAALAYGASIASMANDKIINLMSAAASVSTNITELIDQIVSQIPADIKEVATAVKDLESEYKVPTDLASAVKLPMDMAALLKLPAALSSMGDIVNVASATRPVVEGMMQLFGNGLSLFLKNANM